jgi:hypothetical protein
MNWKEFGKKLSWPNFEVLSRHSPGGSLGRDLNSGPSEYEAGV